MTHAADDGPAEASVDRDANDAATAPPRDLVRRRRIRRIAGGGMAMGVVLSLGAGAAGATGRVGAAILFLVTAAGCAAAATYGALTAVIDDLRDRPVSRGRLGWIVMMFIAAVALMAMTAGVGG